MVLQPRRDVGGEKKFAHHYLNVPWKNIPKMNQKKLLLHKATMFRPARTNRTLAGGKAHLPFHPFSFFFSGVGPVVLLDAAKSSTLHLLNPKLNPNVHRDTAASSYSRWLRCVRMDVGYYAATFTSAELPSTWMLNNEINIPALCIRKLCFTVNSNNENENDFLV